MFLSFVVGDTNGNGKPDVVVLGHSSVARMAVKGSGRLKAPVSSAFTKPPPFPEELKRPVTVLNPSAFAAGDFNGDGRDDLVFAFDIYYFEQAGPFTILDGRGNGSFRQRYPGTEDGDSDAIAVGDLNGDLLPDLVLSSWNTTVGHASVQGAINQPDHSLVRVGFGLSADGYAPAALADLDHDGNLDIATAWYSQGTGFIVAIFDPVGDSPVGAREDLQPEDYRRGTSSIALGDFNGDGWTDIAESVSAYGLIVELNTHGDV